ELFFPARWEFRTTPRRGSEMDSRMWSVRSSDASEATSTSSWLAGYSHPSVSLIFQAMSLSSLRAEISTETDGRKSPDELYRTLLKQPRIQSTNGYPTKTYSSHAALVQKSS